MAKSSSFPPDFRAAASHRGFSPRPAHISDGSSGLRYLGGTAPRTPRPGPLARAPLTTRRSSLLSCSCTVRRSSATLELRTALTCSLSAVSLSTDIDLRFADETFMVLYLTVAD